MNQVITSRGLKAWGISPISWSEVILPVGISFFTFHKISYIVDVYRQTVKPATSYINFALYMVLFPQLIAGPIIRYHDIYQQLERRKHNTSDIFEGLSRFACGLAKKVLLADPMGSVANNVFHLQATQLSSGWAWVGIIAYAYQIYFDFSGYSDMAIGLGRVMGFHFLENFDQPYIARNFTEFWRRWHISLSRWMRDYLYIPLGGNRVKPWRAYLNLWIVFFLSGLWHGASWTFVVWGLYHGFFLVIDKLFWLKLSAKIDTLSLGSLALGRIFNTLLTFFLILFGWVLFRSPNFTSALSYCSHLIFVEQYITPQVFVEPGHIMHNEARFIFGLCTIICFAPVFPLVNSKHLKFVTANNNWGADNTVHSVRQLAKIAFGACCVILSAIALATTSYNPFIYFRF